MQKFGFARFANTQEAYESFVGVPEDCCRRSKTAVTPSNNDHNNYDNDQLSDRYIELNNAMLNHESEIQVELFRNEW